MTPDKAAATAVMIDMATDVEVEVMGAVITAPDGTTTIATEEDIDVTATMTDLVSTAMAAAADVTIDMEAIDEEVATVVEDVMTGPTTEVEIAATVLHLLNMATQPLAERLLTNLMVAATQMRELILVAIKC